MRKKVFFLVFLVVGAMLFPAEPEEIKSSDIDFTAALRFAFNRAKVEWSGGGGENELVYPYLALEVDADILNFLTLGVVAGYNRNSFSGAVDFYRLPLSLRINEARNTSMVLGLNLQTEIVSFSDFVLKGKGEFLYFKLFKNEKTIALPVIEGQATIKNTFWELTVNLMLEYQGLTGANLFFGPRFNLIQGTLTVGEKIVEIEAEEEMKFKQKRWVDLVTGISIDIGTSLELKLAASFLSKTCLSAALCYAF